MIRFIITALATLALAAALPAQTIYRVDAAGGSDANDGSAWTDMGGGVGPMQTVTAALSSATAGDSVWVRQGFYQPTTVMTSDFALSIPGSVEVYGGFDGTEATFPDRASSDPTLTVIDGSVADGGSPGRVIEMAANGAVIDGFTVTGGGTTGGGGGIFASASVTINRCLVTGNSAGASSGGGGGIRAATSGTVVISNTSITNNTGLGGGGVLVRGGGTFNLIDCTIAANRATASGNAGGGIWMQTTSQTSLIRCFIAGNDSNANGGGLALADTASAEVIDSVIIGNHSAMDGGGLGFWSDPGDSAIFTSCVISGNSADGVGGAIHMEDGTTDVSLINCTVAFNAAGVEADGVSAQANPAGFQSLNTLFAGHGTAIDNASADPVTVENTLFFANTANTSSTGGGTVTEIATVPGDPPPNIVGGPSGTWTSVVVSGEVATLTDTGASFTPDAMVGGIIRADTSQAYHYLITANTATSVEVIAHPNLLAGLTSGDNYQVLDFHLDDNSNAVDLGKSAGAPATDLDGNPRNDNPNLPVAAAQTSNVDIGAYEGAVTLVPVELSVFGTE